mmetsp:Transcript_119944/g.373547  ORF Transcript_119944/g.373547 Transcript_119944/m.373547 type:complete len:333 (+) Transcript_119944:499-1497(+)
MLAGVGTAASLEVRGDRQHEDPDVLAVPHASEISVPLGMHVAVVLPCQQQDHLRGCCHPDVGRRRQKPADDEGQVLVLQALAGAQAGEARRRAVAGVRGRQGRVRLCSLGMVLLAASVLLLAPHTTSTVLLLNSAARRPARFARPGSGVGGLAAALCAARPRPPPLRRLGTERLHAPLQEVPRPQVTSGAGVEAPDDQRVARRRALPEPARRVRCPGGLLGLHASTGPADSPSRPRRMGSPSSVLSFDLAASQSTWGRAFRRSAGRGVMLKAAAEIWSCCRHLRLHGISRPCAAVSKVIARRALVLAGNIISVVSIRGGVVQVAAELRSLVV